MRNSRLNKETDAEDEGESRNILIPHANHITSLQVKGRIKPAQGVFFFSFLCTQSIALQAEIGCGIPGFISI